MASKSIEPLDKQTRIVINNISKKDESIQAIDRRFMEDRTCISYVPPPLVILNESNVEYQASLEEYTERLNLVETDLKWLLSLSYQRFWCQVIYDLTCQTMLDSYLKLAPRPHDVFKLKTLPAKVSEIHSNVHKYVFLVCLRMSTYKESKDDFMTKSGYAYFIYNSFLFDIPKILDLCVLYKKNQVLSKMVQNLFETQGNYFEDFKICMKDIIGAFEKSKGSLRKIFDLDSIYYSSQSFDQKNEEMFGRVKENARSALELIYYLNDFSITLIDVTSVEPSLLRYLSKQKFEHNIKELMENTLFYIEDIIIKMIKENDQVVKETGELIKAKLKILKYQLAKLFKSILESGSIKPLIANLDNPALSKDQIKVQEQECLDYFIQVCCDIMEEKRFLCYYEEKFCLSDQINLIAQLTDSLDESQYKFLIENLKSSVMMHSKKKSVKLRFRSSVAKKKIETVTKKSKAQSSLNNETIDNSELESQVQSVLDLLPGTDTNLIKKCIKYFNNNLEQVINAFLENNLPEFAAEETVQNFVQVDEDNDCVTSKFIDDFSELKLRKNIYDGDQFDIFQKNEVDMSKVLLGKKGDLETLDLNDRTDIDRDFYRNYDVIMHERELKAQGIDPKTYDENKEYEDEYDDTYDANTNTNEVEPEFFIKPLNQKLAIKKRDNYDDDDDDDKNNDKNNDEEEENEQTSSNFGNNNQANKPFRNNNADSVNKNIPNQRPNRNQYNQNQQRQYNNQPNSYNQRNNNQRDNYQKDNYQRDNNNGMSQNQPQQQQQQQQQRPLPQRVPKNLSNKLYHVKKNQDENQQFQQQPTQDRQQFSQKFQDRYTKQASKPQNPPKQAFNDQEDSKEDTNLNSERSSSKTAEQIKRDRKWKNDHKNSHRKDQAAKKMGNLF